MFGQVEVGGSALQFVVWRALDSGGPQRVGIPVNSRGKKWPMGEDEDEDLQGEKTGICLSQGCLHSEQHNV